MKFLFVLLISPIIAFAQCNGSTLLCNKKYNEVAYLTTHNAFNSSEDGFTTSNRTILVEVARPIIEIVDNSWTTESSTPPLAGQVTEVFVSVRNTGIVDASDIVLEAVLKESANSEAIESSRLSES